MIRKHRLIAFAALCLLCAALAAGSIRWAALRSADTVARTSSGPENEGGPLAGSRSLVFVNLRTGPTFGTVAIRPLDAANDARVLTSLQCQRVHFGGGRGICLAVDAASEGYIATSFDEGFHVQYTWHGSGFPSRARVSPDGRYAAVTVFVNGDSYANGTFSTRTTLVDLVTGDKLADLEQFSVWRHDARLEAPDFNFWGVTFTRDGDRFYATLGTGGNTFLVEGDLSRRRLEILREGVECPSVSPDGTRVVYKARAGPFAWRLHMLDLASLNDTPLVETRSIDDQVEWLDDAHIAYAFVDSVGLPDVAANVWTLPVDGSASPHVLVGGANSPTIVRDQPLLGARTD